MADDIAKEAREALDYAYDWDKDNREQAIEDLKFTAGFQWSDAARAERKGRPMVTINRSQQFQRQVSNPIRQNMPIIKVEPDRDDDDDMAEIANGLMRRIQYNSSAAHVYAAAVDHMVGCGIGWFRCLHDYVDDESWDQEILIRRIYNPLSVFADPSSLEPARNDMNFCLVSEMVPTKAFKKKYPKAVADGMDTPGDMSRFGAITWGSSDYVRVAEYWKREQVDRTLVQLTNGAVHELTKDGQKQIKMLQEQGLIAGTRKVKGYKVKMYKVSGHEQLEDVYECPSKWIPLIPVIGNEIPLDNGVYRHGLIRFQREPQQLHNYALSVLMETFGMAPKAPIVATAKQIQNYKSLWDNANRSPTPYLVYDPDPAAGGPPQRIDPPPLNQAAVAIAQLMSDDMKATTGIYDAALGAKSNETSGVAIAQRTEQGNQATAHFVDNLEHSLEHLGRIILDMIPKVYDTERTIKIMGEDETEKPVTINKTMFSAGDVTFKHNDMSQMKFQSVRVVLGPNYASRRQEAVAQMVQLIQAMPQIGAVGADIVVRNMDFKGSEELADRLKPPSPEDEQQNPMAQAAAAHESRMMEAQGTKAEADAVKSVAQAQKAHADAMAAQGGAQPQEQDPIAVRQALEDLIGTGLDNDLKRKQLSEPAPQPAGPAG